MTKLQEIAAYLCVNYPYKHELSKARLTKLIYLADWFNAVRAGSQMTDIEWLFNHYGPYVDDVTEELRKDKNFLIKRELNSYGSEKVVIRYENDRFRSSQLSSKEKNLLDAIIEKTKTMYFNDFVEYVYSTYPVRSKEKYSTLDLVKLAKRMNSERG